MIEIIHNLTNKNVEKIPTAEEFIDSKFSKNGNVLSVSSVKKIMIEFAKLHVKEALKQALEDAPYGSSTDTVSYEDMKIILDSYPETNIK